MKQMIHLPRIARIAIAAAVLCASLSFSFAQEAVNGAEARNQEIWRDAIVQTEVPTEGCFQASYPSLTWNEVECVVAPNIPYMPRSGPIGQTVGNGHDYAAEVTSRLITKTVGSFPKVTGVKTEKGLLGANDYSLQINSNLMKTAACDGAGNPSKCRAWQQFIYSSGYTAAFMQYWLITWNNPCPNGWNSYHNDCWTNGFAVTVPQEVITKLKTLKLSGKTTILHLTDVLVFTAGTQAYSTAGLDIMLDLGTAWKESEFNIFGDGNGSEADFNSGSHVTVKVAVSNGTTNAPTCAANAGTTGETNNLNLGSCAGKGGASPYVEFTESN